MTNKVIFHKFYPDAEFPQRQTPGASGWDLHLYMPKELRAEKKNPWDGDHLYIEPGQIVHVKTGIGVTMPPGLEGQVRSRSGMTKIGVVGAGGIGTIDSDYRGQIFVTLVNISNLAYSLNHGERIAQLVFCHVPLIEPTFKDEKPELDTDRGDKGFGSTGC